MPGPHFPDAPPPDVPEEFAATYREAYRRALEQGADEPAEHPAASSTASSGVPTAPSSGSPVMAGPAGVLERWRASRWFLPAAAAVGAVVLLVAAYAVGTSFSGDDRSGSDGAMSPQSSRTTASPKAGSPHRARPTRAATALHGWTGPVKVVGISAIAADCTAPPGTDSAGRTVSYVPANAIDGKADTAWRCTGSAVGQKLVLRLGGATDVAEVGLVPGYAKTDPASGADRYAENNRITRVRWTLADGVQVVQRLDPDPSSRAMQVLRVPRTTTDTVTLEVLSVRRGPRDTTAISTIGLWAAR